MKTGTQLAWLVVSFLALVGVGAWGWSIAPEHPAKWLRLIVSIPAVWLFVELAQGGDSSRDKRSILRFHRRVFFWAALIIAFSVGSRLAIAGQLVSLDGQQLLTRLSGACFGLGLALWGNYLPKVLSPWSAENEPFEWQRVHRFVGWIASLGGISIVAIWTALPLADAAPMARVVLLTTLLLAVGRKLLSVATYTGPPDPTLKDQERTSS